MDVDEELIENLPQDSFAYLTPLTGWAELAPTITDKVSVKSSDENAFPDLDVWSCFLSQVELRDLKDRRRWLWHEYQADCLISGRERRKALQVFDCTRYALQIVAPTGGYGRVFWAKLTSGGWLLDWAEDRPHLNEPLWSRIAQRSTTTAELTTISEALIQAFSRNFVRLQNPVLLLEHGLQATNLHIRVLLWTTGIDALIMAVKANEFCDRLVNLLGGGTFVFPPDRILNRQPKYTVGDVVKDLFELRSEIAHGKTIGKKFRETTGFQTVGGLSVAPPADRLQYRQVLEECAVFLLCAALRKVLKSDLRNDIESEKTWRLRLQRPA